VAASRARTRTKARRRLTLAAVLGSSAILVALAARRPAADPPRRKPSRPAVKVPRKTTVTPRAETTVTPRAKLQRRLVLTAILGASAALSTLAAYQEDSGLAFVILFIGFGGIALVLWLVAWRRWTWNRQDGLLLFALLSLMLLFSTGQAVVTEVILTHRGVRLTVEVAQIRDDYYTLVLPGSSTPLRGELQTSLDFAVGERFTVLYDRGRFVRPMLPEDVNPSVPATFVFVAVVTLAITVLRFGFPLGQGRRDARGLVSQGDRRE